MDNRAYRRVVTETSPDGKSRISQRDAVPVSDVLGMVDFWKVNEVPCRLSENGSMKESRELLPPKGGAIFRFFEIPAARPGATEEELRKEAAQQFAAAGASACQVDTSRHPMMHSTPSLDCVILLRGEVTLILDEEEVKLQPFDVVVQRGANHYWVNTSPEPALFAAVLFDAKP